MLLLALCFTIIIVTDLQMYESGVISLNWSMALSISLKLAIKFLRFFRFRIWIIENYE